MRSKQVENAQRLHDGLFLVKKFIFRYMKHKLRQSPLDRRDTPEVLCS